MKLMLCASIMCFVVTFTGCKDKNYDDDIKRVEKLTQDNTVSINTLKELLSSELAKLKSELTANELAALQDKIAELERIINNLNAAGFVTQEQLNAAIEGITTIINNRITSVNGAINALRIQVERNTTGIAELDKFLKDGLDDLLEANEIDAENLADIIQFLINAIKSNTDAINSNTNSIDKILGFIKSTMEYLEEQECDADLKDVLTALYNKIAANEENIAALLARIQSINVLHDSISIGDYKTPVAVLSGYAYYDEEESQIQQKDILILTFGEYDDEWPTGTEITYLISPASAAAELAEAFNESPSSFSMIVNVAHSNFWEPALMKVGATRALTDDITINIESLVASPNGTITVKIRPADIVGFETIYFNFLLRDNLFYTALKIQTGVNDIVSPFIWLSRRGIYAEGHENWWRD